MANVAYKRKDLVEAEKRYSIIADCLGGEITVKSKGATYLPIPNAEEDPSAVSLRYKAYKDRATFYNVTNRTLKGLCGQIFVREPVIEVPNNMDTLIADADGSGVDLVQMAKAAVEFVLGFGRAGLLVDYPSVDAPTTQEAIDAGKISPTLTLYAPSKILNWRTKTIGAKVLLSLVVLEESFIKADDGFEAVAEKQWRVLRLTAAGYTSTIYEADGASGHKEVATYYPKDSKGNPLTEIPFTFIGARNNDSIIDEPPMYDIAALNIAHYRNSADYEESVFMLGQPTPVFSGLTEDWVTKVLKNKVVLGARGAVTLPVGATASLLQAQPNTMAFEAMKHKEKQMVALGARLVEQNVVVRTASEATIDHNTETSILASTAKNVSVAISWGLVWAGRFLGTPVKAGAFSLNTDFDLAIMSPEARRQLMEEWQGGVITFEEYRAALRKSGIATLDDEAARTKIDEEQAQITLADNLNNGISGGEGKE